MKIIVNGQQAFGKAVLEALLNREEEVIGVYCAPDIEGRPLDPLKEFAKEKGLPVYQPTSFRQETVREQIRSLKSDLCVMAYVTTFVPEEVLNIPTLGTIQYHPSLLPMHKGPSSINWPIIFGEKCIQLASVSSGQTMAQILLRICSRIRWVDDALRKRAPFNIWALGIQKRFQLT